MEKEQERNDTNTDNEQEQDYLEAIQNLKDNTVSKEQYEKLRAENKKLLNAVLNDQKADNKEEPVETVEQLQKELKSIKKDLATAQEKGMSNLEFCSKALKYREKAMKLGLQDPFVPNSPTGPDDNDFKSAEKVAEVLQNCVDEAKGNPASFRNLFEQAVRDDSKIPIKRKK